MIPRSLRTDAWTNLFSFVNRVLPIQFFFLFLILSLFNIQSPPLNDSVENRTALYPSYNHYCSLAKPFILTSVKLDSAHEPLTENSKSFKKVHHPLRSFNLPPRNNFRMNCFFFMISLLNLHMCIWKKEFFF